MSDMYLNNDGYSAKYFQERLKEACEPVVYFCNIDEDLNITMYHGQVYALCPSRNEAHVSTPQGLICTRFSRLSETMQGAWELARNELWDHSDNIFQTVRRLPDEYATTSSKSEEMDSGAEPGSENLEGVSPEAGSDSEGED